MKRISLSPISLIIKDAKKGKIFILVDNKNRENEGDLVIPASKANSKSINFRLPKSNYILEVLVLSPDMKTLFLDLNTYFYQ